MKRNRRTAKTPQSSKPPMIPTTNPTTNVVEPLSLSMVEGSCPSETEPDQEVEEELEEESKVEVARDPVATAVPVTTEEETIEEDDPVTELCPVAVEEVVVDDKVEEAEVTEDVDETDVEDREEEEEVEVEDTVADVDVEDVAALLEEVAIDDVVVEGNSSEKSKMSMKLLHADPPLVSPPANMTTFPQTPGVRYTRCTARVEVLHDPVTMS